MAEQKTPEPNGAGQDTRPLSEAEVLKARVEAAEQQRDEYLTLAKQVRAEFENYQKRFQRDLAVERQYAQTPLAGDLLGSIDNLDRALDAADKADDKGPLAQGVALVRNQLLDALRRHGVIRIEAVGQPFDPNLHQAVAQDPPGAFSFPVKFIVKEVLGHGYKLHDRVLRPANVVVSAVPADKPD
jgi:molecular chaperone GrpE